MEKASIRLAGGLGNYLFEIACAYAYAKKHNKQLVLSKESSVVIHKHLDEYKENVLKNCQQFFVPNIQFNNPKSIPESSFSYQEPPFIEGDVLIEGHRQSSKYFDEYKDDIKEIFKINENVFDKVYERNICDVIEKIKNSNSCSIHVRRGDYLNSPNHHPLQNMNYYMKAIKQMPKDSFFFIFSDDIQWCRQSFPDIPEKFVFVEGFKDYEDLFLQSICKNNIICNSTFSWWSAYLNDNPNKIVVIPSIWFGQAYSHYDTSDLYCEGWIKI